MMKRPFEGVMPNMERLYAESESEFTRNRLKAFMSPQFCDACKGKRLRPEILAVTLGRCVSEIRNLKSAIRNWQIPGLSIMDVCLLSVDKADEFFASLKLTEFQQKIAGEVIKEIRARLGLPEERRAGLSHAGSRERLVERRRGAAHPAGDADRRGAGGRALHSG